MSKAEAILKIEPENELRFRGKSGNLCRQNYHVLSKVKQPLKISNVSNLRRLPCYYLPPGTF